MWLPLVLGSHLEEQGIYNFPSLLSFLSAPVAHKQASSIPQMPFPLKLLLQLSAISNKPSESGDHACCHDITYPLSLAFPPYPTTLLELFFQVTSNILIASFNVYF